MNVHKHMFYTDFSIARLQFLCNLHFTGWILFQVTTFVILTKLMFVGNFCFTATIRRELVLETRLLRCLWLKNVFQRIESFAVPKGHTFLPKKSSIELIFGKKVIFSSNKAVWKTMICGTNRTKLNWNVVFANWMWIKVFFFAKYVVFC